MAYFLVLNGPNLNLLGQREPGIYGTQTLAQINEALKIQAESAGHRIAFLQSNAEHELVEAVQNAPAQGVDAILINQAPFDQPFPHIILEFKNINGVLIADGSFSPEQYLSGVMTGAIDMRSKTPVHISFSVVSPGNDAVNYSLRYQ